MDKLIYIDKYFDGPLSGITVIGKEKYYFLLPFSEEKDDYENTAKLYPISGLLIYGHFSKIRDAEDALEQLDCEQIKSLLEMIIEKGIIPIDGTPQFERHMSGIAASSFTVKWLNVGKGSD